MAESQISSVDQIARRVLERTGRVEIVQLGAFVGATSNDPLFTFLKEVSASAADRRRVRAVLVEPVRPFFDTLLANYADAIGTVLLENLAIGEAMALRPFWRLATDRLPHEFGLPDFLLQLGSLRADRTTALWDAHEANDPIHAGRAEDMRRFLQERTVCDQVFTVTLPQLLTKHAMPCPDLLVMDVEGYESVILRSLDYVTFRPRMIVFEHVLLGAEAEACDDLLRAHGYRVSRFSADTLAIADEACELLGLRLPVQPTAAPPPSIGTSSDDAAQNPVDGPSSSHAAIDEAGAASARSSGVEQVADVEQSAAGTTDTAEPHEPIAAPIESALEAAMSRVVFASAPRSFTGGLAEAPSPEPAPSRSAEDAQSRASDATASAQPRAFLQPDAAALDVDLQPGGPNAGGAPGSPDAASPEPSSSRIAVEPMISTANPAEELAASEPDRALPPVPSSGRREELSAGPGDDPEEGASPTWAARSVLPESTARSNLMPEQHRSRGPVPGQDAAPHDTSTTVRDEPVATPTNSVSGLAEGSAPEHRPTEEIPASIHPPSHQPATFIEPRRPERTRLGFAAIASELLSTETARRSP